MFETHPLVAPGRYQTLLGSFSVAVLAGLLFFFQLGAKDIWGRPEGRTAVIARRMVETSRYLVPELFDRPFIDNRPPGYYWLAALAYKVTGSSGELFARVPAALGAVLCVLAVYAFGCRVGGFRAGFWASIALLGMVKFAWQARLAEQDMLVALWTCLGYWAFWYWLHPKEGFQRTHASRLGWAVLLQVLVGLGAMTKGPAIGITFVFPAAIYVAASRRWKQVDWTMLLATSPIAVGLSLWWFLYIWVSLPQEHAQLLGRFLNQSSMHVRSWYYYLVKMPALLGPATLLLPLLWWKWREAGAEERRGLLGFSLAWFLGNVVLFSLFPSKQTHYLVPAFPGLALALGLVLAHPPSHGHRLNVWFVQLIMAALLLAPLGWLVFSPLKIGLGSPAVVGFVVLACSAAVAILGLSLRAGRIGFAFRAAWCFWLLGMGVVFGEVVPRFNAMQSPRWFIDQVNESLPAGARLGLLDDHPGVVAYLNKPVLLFEDATAARAFLEASDLDYLLAESDELDDDFKDFQRAGTVVVLKQDGFMKRHTTAYLLRDPD